MVKNFTGKPSIIIAHRGASGYRPEHTLAAYELAMPTAGYAYALGADYIEPDLVSTKDGVLIARHENEISETTDVASHAEFAHHQVSGNDSTYADLATASGLREIAKYAQAVGIHKNLLVPRDSSGKLRSPTSLVTDAHTAGLLVHVWTFRNEDCFLPLDFQGNPQGEYELFFSLGVDGVFSDYPDTAFAVNEKLRFNF
ncbi:glycerophosphodiester phosphodiesterase family protein [Nostoc sp. UHCC 0926]|uniref:glycerophosphodiester phosphodiesterase family protein n=1 Tax=unclassified Nostoc TaxID=2593658 RepID=UPI00235E732A|nr:glycerophosphodiester phosphodiesterase family protein [Nostoc sp. UHCC 0926]WDD35121.1 glycerophosphodiester phosphodiesterase family protein [Nostoc sp. UHCC 0926]